MPRRTKVVFFRFTHPVFAVTKSYKSITILILYEYTYIWHKDCVKKFMATFRYGYPLELRSSLRTPLYMNFFKIIKPVLA